MLKTTLKNSIHALIFAGALTLSGTAMAAGNVSLSVVDGQLRIVGDGNANQIQLEGALVSSTAKRGVLVLPTIKPGVRVSGINGTTVNQQPAVSVPSPANGIDVRLNDGNDQINLRPGVAVPFIGPLTIDMGSGADTVDIRDVTVNGDIFVHTDGSGDDVVSVKECIVNGNLTIETDSGNDTILVRATDVTNDISISSEDGDDDVSLFETEVFNVVIDTADDDDVVVVFDSTVEGILLATTGQDQDQVVLIASLFADLFVDLGGNDDVLLLGTVVVEGDALLDGGGGDNVLIDNGIEAGNLEIDDFEGN